MTLDEIRAQHPEYDDMSDEDLAGALHRKFYADIPRVEFDKKIGLKSGSLTAAKGMTANAVNQGSALDPILQGATFGFGDELIGGAAGLMSKAGGGEFTSAYESTRDRAREGLENFRERNPIGSTALEIAGGIPTAFIPLGAAARGARLGTKVARGALAGGVSGAAYGAGAADGDMADRAGGAAAGLATGATIGGAVPLVGRAIGKSIGSRAGAKAAPTTDELGRASQAFYQASEQQGLAINQSAFANMATNMIADLNAAGIDKGIQPKAFAAANRVISAANTGVSPTLKDIDLLRQLSVGIARDGLAGKNEQRIAGKIIEHLDDFVDNLKPGDVVAGDPIKAVSFLNRGRALYKSKAKADLIEQAIATARKSASGFEAGLRNEFRKLSNSKRLARYWTKDERAAIDRVISGTTTGNLLRFLGTMGMPIDQARNWLGVAMGGGGVGAMLGSPVAGIAAVGAGTAAKYGARGVTRGLAKQTGAVARSGGRVPFDQAAARLAEERANRLLQAGGRAVVPQIIPR